MTKSIYNIVMLASGWLVYCDGAKIGGTHGSKEAAAAAALAVRDGRAIQINVPGSLESCSQSHGQGPRSRKQKDSDQETSCKRQRPNVQAGTMRTRMEVRRDIVGSIRHYGRSPSQQLLGP
jgi:hypothetical protein